MALILENEIIIINKRDSKQPNGCLSSQWTLLLSFMTHTQSNPQTLAILFTDMQIKCKQFEFYMV